MKQDQIFEDKMRINDKRHELVVKSNDLIRNTRYNMSALEQKIVIYLISKICAEDKDLKTVELSVKEYCDLTGIKKGGTGYKLVKDSIKSLRNKSWWIPLSENKETLFSWIDTAIIEKQNGIIEITLSDSLKPYLLELKGNFTKFELINVLTLHSKYSIRLYEIFKSYLWLGYWDVYIDDLRELVGLEDKYKDYRDLKKFVIDPAVKEISAQTDLQISYETIKSGRTINKLMFRINEKKGYQLTWETILNQNKRLNNEW